MSFEEFYIHLAEHNKACSFNFWAGCGVGTVGALIIVVVSLWVAGAFLP